MSYKTFRLPLYLPLFIGLMMVALPGNWPGSLLVQAFVPRHDGFVQAENAARITSPGVTTSADEDIALETRTDDAGYFRFEGLPHGTHKVTLDSATLPPTWRLAEGETTPTLWVIPGQKQTSDMFAGGVRFTVAYDKDTGALAGRVFVDNDGDGRLGPGDAGLAGVTVIDPTIHQYFVPFDDLDLIDIFRASNACQGQQGPGGTPVGYILTSGVSVVASSNGTVYYYDHWEDGYDADPLQPGPTSTTISGTLNAGQYQPFPSEIDTRLVGSGPPYYYDGRDRITVVGEDAAVIRYAYPSLAETGIGSMFAGAWEIEQTANWGTEYIIPAGEDWGARSDFAFTAASIMAAQNNTQVYRNGVLVTPVPLKMGETYYAPGAGGGLNSGDVFTATGPIMSSLYASVCDLYYIGGPGIPWSGNGYTLEPLAHWKSDYWSPVPSRNTPACDNTQTDIFVYNDNLADITVTVDDGTATNITLPARSSSSVRTLLALQGRSLSTTRGAHLVAPGGERFWGVVNFDTRRTYYEWGFSLVHDPSSQVILGWSPGNAAVPPTATIPPNGNMAWVTPVTNTVVFVDLNGDGTPDRIDCNGNGNATNMGVDGICDEPTSNLGITLTQGLTLRVGRPVVAGDPRSADLSGARIYSRNFNEKITVAWGEDSCVALRRTPYLDLGYTVLPLTSHSLAITKTAEPSPVQAGAVLTYTLAWGVSGFSPAPNVTISDTVPANTTLITASLPVTVSGTLLTWPLGDRAPGDSGLVTFTVQVAQPLISGTLILNSTIITDATGINDTDIFTVPVVSHVLSVTKSASAHVVLAGAPLTYTIGWGVTGSGPAFGVTVSDTVPQDTIYQACYGAPCIESGGVVTWQLGTVLPPASGVVTLVVLVDVGLAPGTVLANSVTITDTSGLTSTHTITTVVTVGADLAIFKSDEPDPVVPGTLLTYTLVIVNNGPTNAADVIVSDTLPAQVSFVSATPTPASTTPLTWYLGTLTVGETRRLTVTVQVSPSATGVFTNTASVNTPTPDDYPPNNVAHEQTTPLAPGLVLVKSVTPGEIARGMPFTYTIRITNTGNITLNPVVLTDTLPPDFYYVVGSGVPFPPDLVAEPLLRWDIPGDFVPSASFTVAFGVTTTTSITGTFLNTATVAGQYPGGVLTDTDVVPVILQGPRLALTKHLIGYDTDPVAPNYVTFTVVITNVGVTVIDRLPLYDDYNPDYLSFVWAAPMTNTQSPGLLTWSDLTAQPPNGFDRNLAPGQAFSVTTVFVVIRNITTTIYNTARVGNAMDVYDNPTNRPEDTVPIIGPPTAVELLYFRVDGVSGRQVRLAWATAVEIDNLGFNLYRGDANAPSGASLIHFEPASAMGGRLGATYMYTDTVPVDGTWWYWLAGVDTWGIETRWTNATVRAEVNAALRYRVYLPVVIKQP